MLVSVALPIYNGMPHLEHAIKSILLQEIDFEVVISDDGSRDGSLEFLHSIDDGRLRVLPNKENAGILAISIDASWRPAVILFKCFAKTIL